MYLMGSAGDLVGDPGEFLSNTGRIYKILKENNKKIQQT